MSVTTKQYAVLGHPIAHSLSPRIHQAFAADCGIELSYQAIEVDPGNFPQFIAEFFVQGQGVNVTLPFKEQAFALLADTDQSAQAAQAVNTIKKLADGSLRGYNTDGIGLVTDLVNNLNFALHDKRILLVGAGGAARGVIEPLLAQQPQQLIITNRSLSRAEQLVPQFAALGNIEALALAELKQPFDLIINATSASLSGALPQLPAQIIQPQHSCCYDMMYGATDTIFNQWGQQLAAKQTWDGLGMLVEQAAAAFKLWHAVQPNTRSILSELRAYLAG